MTFQIFHYFLFKKKTAISCGLNYCMILILLKEIKLPAYRRWKRETRGLRVKNISSLKIQVLRNLLRNW